MSTDTQHEVCVKTLTGLSCIVRVTSEVTIRELKARAVLSLGGSTKPASLNRVSLCFKSRTLEEESHVEDAMIDAGQFLVLLGFKRLKVPEWKVDEYDENKPVWSTWVEGVLPGVRYVEKYDRGRPS